MANPNILNRPVQNDSLGTNEGGMSSEEGSRHTKDDTLSIQEEYKT